MAASVPPAGGDTLASLSASNCTGATFARAARRRGVRIIEGVEVEQLLLEDGRVVGVETSQGRFSSATVVSAQNIWARDIERWTGI